MRFRSLLAIVAVGLIAFTVAGARFAPASSADETETELGRLVMVLDSSGSMEELDQSGMTKIDAAKQSLHTVVDDLPDQADVGMRVFGATVFSRDDEGACQDSQLVVPLGTDNRDDLSKQIDKYEPFGETPIAYALKEAAKDIGGEGKRTILLVSDGEATCDPDPCEVAADIAAQGIDIRIDVVGLDVDGAARDQLKCVADKGNGTYYDAGNADELTDSMATVSTRAAQPFEATGEPVEGTPTPENAPQLQTGGQYVDTIPPDGTPKHYKITREAANSTIIASAITKTGSGDAVVASTSLELRTLDGQACDSNLSMVTERSVSGLISGSVSSLSYESTDPNGACNTSPELLLVLEPDPRLQEAPVQLKTWEYGQVADWDALPEAASDQGIPWEPMAADVSNAEDLTGGTSFESAPQITPDQTYASNLVPGESRVFRVSADWGQRIQAQATIDRSSKQMSAMPALVGMNVKAFSPTGSEVGIDDHVETSSWTVGVNNGEHALETGTADIRFRNRLSNADTVASTSQPGDYYIIVSLAYDADAENVEVPFFLTTKLEGEKGGGAPEFAMTREPGDATTEGKDDASDEPTDSSTSDEPSTPAESEPETDDVEPTASSSDGIEMDGATVGIGLGGIGLLLLGGYGIRRLLG